MDYLDYVNEHRRLLIRVPRIQVRDRMDPLTYFSDYNFRDRFRMYKETFVDFVMILEPLFPPAPRGKAISPKLQVLITIRYFALGTTGDLRTVSDATVCRTVHKVCRLICSLFKSFIKFPRNNIEILLASYKEKFFEIANFPGVVGCIDGSHVPIVKPSSPDFEEYRCRKGYFSLNVQGVCTADLLFTNIVARWKGAMHDFRIYNNSRIFNIIENDNFGGIILGDTGYAQSRRLFTPLPHPRTPEQQAYNRSHKSTRNTIKRAFGVWKGRFVCLQNKIKFRPERAANIIIATAILHNFIKLRGEPDVEPFLEPEGPQIVLRLNREQQLIGNRSRQAFITQHFR